MPDSLRRRNRSNEGPSLSHDTSEALLLPMAHSTVRTKHDRRKEIIYTFIAMLCVLALLVAVIVYAELFAKKSSPPSTPLVLVNCYPDYNNYNNYTTMTASECTRRGCLWNASETEFMKQCVFSTDSNSFAGYDVAQASNGVYTLSRRKTPSLFAGDLNTIAVNFTRLSTSILRVTFFDPAKARFQPPVTVVPTGQWATMDGPSLYEFTVTKAPFGFAVRRTNTSEQALFNTTSIPGLTFADQFLQLTAQIATTQIYGFGEHTHHTLRHNLTYTRWPMWSRDDGVYDGNFNLYGVHPFYLGLEASGRAHGVLLLNANAQEVELQPAPAITYRTTGGLLDFYFFLGPTPDEVIRQYVSSIGLPMLPPYWSLGFHLCRWGYTNLTHMQMVNNRMREYGIPQDTQWADIDYMYAYYDFTVNPDGWWGLAEFVDTLHQEFGQRFVMIIDPGIPSQPNLTALGRDYAPLSDGIAQNIFLKNAEGKNFPAKVWPGPVYMPDFTHVNATAWWSSQLHTFHTTLSFDGVWIDMNEPSNFNDDNNYNNDYAAECSHNPSLNWPAYRPPIKDAGVAGLWGKTMCMDTEHGWGLHYDVHSLYGHSEAIATRDALRSLGKRPFVLSRSTFVSSGHHTFKWLGDNQALWPEMAWSIIGMLEFNMFGIPFVGSDICGFVYDTSVELCQRWTHLGAFYPFSRNHNIQGAIDQDPGAFGKSFAQSARRILLERYRLLPYLYTLLFTSHADGSPVARPLFFEFPTDAATWSIDDQFLWGHGLMIAPVLKEGAISRFVYFPATRWFDYWTLQEVSGPNASNQTVDCDLDCLPLYLQGGFILPMQLPNITTNSSRSNNITLLVALDYAQQAKGSLFWDDGESPDTVENGAYNLLSFTVQTTVNDLGKNSSMLTVAWTRRGFISRLFIDTVKVTGLDAANGTVMIFDVAWSCSLDGEQSCSIVLHP